MTSKVSVEHGEVFHGSSTTMPCPAGYNGTVTFACNDDDLTLVRGKCGKRCAPGTVEYRLDEKDPFSRALDYPDMDDGEELPTDCPGSLVGTVQLKCQDGAVLLREDQQLVIHVFDQLAGRCFGFRMFHEKPGSECISPRIS